jgi:hypothetical protein
MVIAVTYIVKTAGTIEKFQFGGGIGCSLSAKVDKGGI